MAISIIQLNGQSELFDYRLFELQANELLIKTCREATLVLLNRFPVPTSSEINTDVVISFAIDKNTPGNYFRQSKNNGWVNISNFVVSLSFLDVQDKCKILLGDNKEIFIDGNYYDFSPLAKSLKYGLREYLVNRCSFQKNEVNIFPLIFIKHSTVEYFGNDVLIAKDFNFDILIKYLISVSDQNINSCRRWNVENGYIHFVEDIQRINDKASEDSRYGYLTKKKIDRLANTISRTIRKKRQKKHDGNVLFDEDVFEEMKVNDFEEIEDLSDRLILFDGKAGTGKTTELIKLMVKTLRNNRSARFFTYNHLLVYDIAKTISAFGNSLYSEKQIPDERMQGYSVMTLHSFLFRLSKNLGVLHLMTERRIRELKATLNERLIVAISVIRSIVKCNGERLVYSNDSIILKEIISNSKTLDVAHKEVAVDFINFLHFKKHSVTSKYEESSIEFVNSKIDSLESICVNGIFISDYYGVLINVLKAINDPSKFYDEYNIESKFELLYTTMHYNKNYLKNEDLQNEIIPRKIYVQRVNRVISGHRMGNALVLIDEGQDCHRDEKEILYKIFLPKNMAVATGGKEQLIRHVELCNWHTSNNTNVPYKVYPMQNVSYRVKGKPLQLCNYIANKFNIALNLVPLQTEDDGEIIIDLRRSLNAETASDVFKELLLKGKVSDCSPYESLLVLLNSNIDYNNEMNYEMSAIINEFGNIEEHKGAAENNWEFKSVLGKHCEYWDGTNDEIRKHTVPSYQEVRTIFYNSCRGLESWSVACFEIDKFFDKKRSEKDAEIYLMETLFSLEERKSMYAGTWALMAMTRAIDTLYLKISNKESEFGKAILEFANDNPGKFKIYQD